MVARKHNRVSKPSYTLNALMALTFLVFHTSVRCVVKLLYLINNIVVIGSIATMIVHLYLERASSPAHLKTLRADVTAWRMIER